VNASSVLASKRAAADPGVARHLRRGAVQR
jgi:hypothetical protein